MRLGTIAFFAGVCLLLQFSQLPSPWWGAVLLPALLLVSRYRKLRLPLMFLFGLLWASMHASIMLQRTLAADLEGKDIVVDGRIASIPERRQHSLRFELAPLGSPDPTVSDRLPRRLRLSWYGRAPALEADDVWRLTVRLKRPNGLMNPGGFDYEAWLFQHGIGATGYVRKQAGNRRLRRAIGLTRLRQSIAAAIHRSLPESANAGVIAALAVGARSGMSAPQWGVLTATGTNHLLAISGLHIGLVAGLVLLLTRRLWAQSTRLTNRFAAPRAGAVAALLAATIYAALAGFSIPTQRALIMLLVILGAQITRRHNQPSRSLAMALLGVLILDPLAVLAPGFWLSFAAVATILFGMSGRLTMTGLWWRWGRVQWLVALALLPLSLLFFQRVSLVAPLANLLAVPWVSLLVVPLVLVATICLAVYPPLAAALLHVADALISAMWALLHAMAAWPLAQYVHAAPAPWALAAALLGAALWAAPRGLPGRGVALLLLLPSLLTRPPSLMHGRAYFTLLDVGEGLSAVIQTRHHSLVFDTGPRHSARFDTGSAVVIPFLRARGITQVDRLIVSHSDNDHRGGADAVLAQIAVADVWSGVPESMPGRAAVACRQGQQWQWDGVRFQILNPPAINPLKTNNRSCVLRVDAGGDSVLLTGDIERDAERRLLREQRPLLAASILVVPHHGSATSSSAAFIDAVRPHYALVPAGYRNRFGFPKAVVVKRYLERGITLLDSSREGAMSFVLGSGAADITAHSYRRSEGRFWNRR